MTDPARDAQPDTEPDTEQEWPTHCPVCGTEMSSAVIDFDKTNADHPELRPGEMAAVDFCPNPDCPAKRADI
jgi:hypothetical protein